MSLTPSRKVCRDQHLRSIESFDAVYGGNRPFTEFDASEANAVEHEPLVAYVLQVPT